MELLSFLKLYINMDNLNATSMLVMLAMLYFNAGCYLVDLYGIVKKKSQGETIAIMLFPGTLAVMGSAMTGLFNNVPATQAGLAEFARRLESGTLMQDFITVLLFYAAAWAVAWNPKGQHRDKKAFTRWVLSCVPDFIFAAAVLFISCYRLIRGSSIFGVTKGISLKMGFNYDIFLWLFLQIFMILICKIILLFVGSFARAYSHRIPHSWKEGRNPVRYVVTHFCVCQNALLRGSLAFWLPMLTFFTGLFIREVNFNKADVNMAGMVVIILFMYGGFILVTSVIMTKPLNAIFRFWQWGDHRELMTLFCRETCVEAPVIAGGDFTVTKHFLIDEQSPAAVYYLNELASCTGWTFEKNRWVKSIRFRDGQVCIIDKKDPSGEAVAAFVKQWLNEHAVENIQKAGARTKKSKQQRRYEGFQQKIVMIAVITFMLISYNGDELLKTNNSNSSKQTSASDKKIPRPTVPDKKPQANQDEEDVFPVLVASNDDFNIYAKSLSKSVWSTDKVERDGKIFIVNTYANKVSLEVRSKSAVIQKISYATPQLAPEYTVLSGDLNRSEFARLEDVNFDGFDDLLLYYDNKTSNKWSAYIWNGETKKFNADKTFTDIEFYRVDNGNKCIWGHTAASDMTVETYVYAEGEGFKPDRKLLVTRNYDREFTEQPFYYLFYEEYVYEAGEPVLIMQTENYDEIDEFWKKGYFEHEHN